MSRTSTILWMVMLAALLSRYESKSSSHKILITNEDGSFRFAVDEGTPGIHTFEASLRFDCWYFLLDQSESGVLSEKDWTKLNKFHRLKNLPPADEHALQEPGEIWGRMQRGNETMMLRYAEWLELSNTQVLQSYWSMIYKAKNG